MGGFARRVCQAGLGGLLLLANGFGLGAQTAIADQAIVQELSDLAHHAPLIFVGQIVEIQRSAGLVRVHFRVERTISGNPGPEYVMQEWAGVWPPGYARYAVGTRVLAFLHAPSAAGASSPVHGAEGLVPVVVQGANAPQLLDIRRVAASVERSPSTPLPLTAGWTIPLQQAVMAFEGTGSSWNARFLWQTPALRAQVPEAFQPHRRTVLSAPEPHVQVFAPSRTGGAVHVAR